MEELHLDDLDIHDLDDVIKDVDLSSNDVPIEPKPKRKRTPNQIKAGLKNLELARKTRMKNAQKRRLWVRDSQTMVRKKAINGGIQKPKEPDR